MPPVYNFLSDTSRLLCLDMLSRWPSERWMWLNDGQTPTDSQWDEAEAMVDQAVQELISPMLTGVIFPFAGETVPDGFLLCNGQAVSQEDYDDLFAVIGNIYGLSDVGTFVLPNLTGRVPVGRRDNWVEFNTLGKKGGNRTHTLTTTEMPSHEHPHYHSEGIAIAAIINGGLEAPAAAAEPFVGNTGSAGGLTGGGEAHNNLQPYLVLNFIIKI